MSRIENKFKELKERGEGALIPYITLGDPSIEKSIEIAQALGSKADILELGIHLR